MSTQSPPLDTRVMILTSAMYGKYGTVIDREIAVAIDLDMRRYLVQVDGDPFEMLFTRDELARLT